MEDKTKIICLICQDYTNHVTSKCPNIRCKSCGQLGHANRDCLSTNVAMNSKQFPEKFVVSEKTRLEGKVLKYVSVVSTYVFIMHE